MPTPRELVETLGGHPADALGLDLASDTGLWRWLVAACLLGAPEPKGIAGFRALEADDCDPAALAGSSATELALRLEAAGLPRPERAALTLVRAADALASRHAGSLGALLAEAGDLEALGGSLVGLAPGLGAGTALRFLRPLRDRLPGAAETPPAAPALAAAACLGWLPADLDPESAEAELLRLLEGAEDAAPRDVEAALERLGAASCKAQRPGRCPLAADCPLRYRQGP